MLPMSMASDFDNLKDTILDLCQDGPVYYFPNPGNWGDALIRYGTIKFFDDIGLHYTELNAASEIVKGGTVIYADSGAWCRLWNHAESYVRLFSKTAKVIVLPSTYEARYFVTNTSFFVRDKYESLENMPKAKFCHDLAFYIDEDFVQQIKNEGTGNFFRTDAESLNGSKGIENNDDISSRGNHLTDIVPFFHTVNRFSVIRTDRLHVAIAACLLKKEVHIYANSYFKNRAVFNSSIAPYFEKVYFYEK